MPAYVWSTSVLPILVAFALSMLIAWFYTRLDHGLAYGQSFVQSLAVAGVISAALVLAIGDNVARGIGLVGAVALVRFRSNLRDPRDLIFTFAALACGVAAGAAAYFVAVFGTAVFMAGMYLGSRPWFARQDTFDAIVSVHAATEGATADAVARELAMRCDAVALLRVRPSGVSSQEHAYRVALKDTRARVDLVQRLQRIDGVTHAQLITYEPLPEL